MASDEFGQKAPGEETEATEIDRFIEIFMKNPGMRYLGAEPAQIGKDSDSLGTAATTDCLLVFDTPAPDDLTKNLAVDVNTVFGAALQCQKNGQNDTLNAMKAAFVDQLLGMNRVFGGFPLSERGSHSVRRVPPSGGGRPTARPLGGPS